MHSQSKFLEIGTYCYLSKASKNLLQEIKRYCQPKTDLRRVFFAVASSLQATKKSRKKDKKSLHFTVLLLQNTTARPVGKGRWAAFGRFCHRKCFAANGNQERRGLHGLQLLAFCKTKKGRKGRKQGSNVGHHHTMPPPPSPRPFPPPPSSLVVACTIHVVRN